MAYDLILRKKNGGGRNWSRSSSGMGSDFDSGWDEIGIVSSSVARATADAVRADLDALNLEITAWYQRVASQRKPAHGVFVNAWIRFRDETYKMIDDSKRFWNPELASSIVERLNLTQANLRNWRARYEAIAGEKSQTSLTQIAPPPSSDKGSSPWMYVAIGLGGVVLVGGGLIYFLGPMLIGRGAMAKVGI